MWLPDWLYEAMPFVYMVAGFAAIFHFGTPAGLAVGVLLLLAALMILKMRKDARAFKETIRLAEDLIDYR